MGRIWSVLALATLGASALLSACEFPKYGFVNDAENSNDASVNAEAGAPGTEPTPVEDAGLPGNGSGTDGGPSDADASDSAVDSGSTCETGHVVDARCGETHCTSCQQLKEDDACAPSGTYTIDPDGSGVLTAFDVHCDMKFDGGGWTLIVSTLPPDGPYNLPVKTVVPGASAFLAPVQMQSIAANATQVHIRTSGKAEIESVTSRRNTKPIVNLRALKILNAGIPVDDPAAQVAVWTGPYATESFLRFRCVPADPGYPSSYEACGETGLFLTGTHARWAWTDGDTQQNAALEVYIR